MTEVIKIDGAPGVGKSTRLFEYVEGEKEDGRSLSDLYYLTFTRSGREESATRLGEIYPRADKEDLLKRAKPFHGAAWVACAIDGLWEDPNEQIIQPSTDGDVYEAFCNRFGLTYGGESNALKALRDGEDIDGAGDALFAKNDWLQLTRRDFTDHHLAPTSMSLDHDRVTDLLKAWSEFKESGRPDRSLPIYEHADYVDVAIERGLTPPAEVLFLDEFQDLSPQEYALYKQWRDSGAFDRIFIAGDPNQSIYSFRAGTPLYFEETDVDDVEVRKKSYRCPEAVVKAARGILERCSETDPRGFTAARPGGEVSEVTIDRAEDLGRFVKHQAERHGSEEGTSVMLLTRANYQVYALSKALRSVGVPHEFLGSRSTAWDEELSTLLAALRRLARNTGGLDKGKADTLFGYSPQSKRRKAEAGGLNGGVYRISGLWEAYSEFDNAAQIANHLDLPEFKRDMLAGAVSTTTVKKPEHVKLGTIHAAKGLEAPSVLLFDGYTSRLMDAYDDGQMAEEHRLYYVGATRASKTLNIVRGYFDGHTVPIFDGGIPTYDGEVVA